MNQELKIENSEPFTALPTAVQWSHAILGPRLRPGDLVVDATAGNGHDTLFLAQHVLPGGHIFAFDVQAGAIDQTRRRLTPHLPLSAPGCITLHHAGHERMAELLPADACGRLRAVMFNLGWLPGADKTLVTQVETTLTALAQAVDWLAPDGMLTVVAYPGHAGGRDEADAVVRWMAQLPSDQCEVQQLRFLNFRATTPFCLVLRRRV